MKIPKHVLKNTYDQSSRKFKSKKRKQLRELKNALLNYNVVVLISLTGLMTWIKSVSC